MAKLRLRPVWEFHGKRGAVANRHNLSPSQAVRLKLGTLFRLGLMEFGVNVRKIPTRVGLEIHNSKEYDKTISM